MDKVFKSADIMKSGGASQLLDTNAAKALLESLSMDIRSVVEPSYHIAIDQALEHEKRKVPAPRERADSTMNEFFRKSRASFKKILETVRRPFRWKSMGISQRFPLTPSRTFARRCSTMTRSATFQNVSQDHSFSVETRPHGYRKHRCRSASEAPFGATEVAKSCI